MFFGRLLLPFKWLFIGLWLIINYIVKNIFSFLSSLVIYFYNGMIYIFKKIIWLIKNFFFFIYRMLRYIGYGFYIIVKTVVVSFFIGMRTFLLFLFKMIKVFSLYLFNGLKVFFTFIYKILYRIILILYKCLYYIVFNMIMGMKAVGIFILNKILVGLKFLSKIPYFFWIGIKWFAYLLYKSFIFPFVYIYNNIREILLKSVDFIKSTIQKLVKFIIGIPGMIKTKAINWYNNLSIVKHIRNKREMKRQTLLIDFEAEDAVRSEQKVLYRYLAKNSEGKIEKGKISAYSKLDVHSYLLSEGYEVYEIEIAKGLNIKIGFNYKMKTGELVFLLTQLSTYIKSGITLVDSIKILSKQTRKMALKDLYRSIIYELTMGENFSEALAKQGNSFPKLLTNMIKASEIAGNLPETLDSMADYYTAIYKTKRQMLTAIMYPTVIFCFATIIIFFIMIFVIPEFVTIYEGVGSEIPSITRFTISASEYLTANYIYIIFTIIAIVVAFIFIYNNVKMFKILVQWIMMHMPVIGKIIIYNEVTMFAKTFGSLLKHNVFITDSMEILSKITNNEIYKMLIFDTITNLARGESISISFKNHWAFPVVAYEMLLTGERTGQPGPMMEKVADYYQEEHRNAVNQVKTFIEPVMIVVLALVVGFILLSVIIPMFNLYGTLG